MLPIKKVFAAPGQFNPGIRKAAARNKIICFEIDTGNDDDLIELMWATLFVDQPKLESLIASLAFLTCCHSSKSGETHEEQIQKACLEGSIGQDLVGNLQQQRHLENWGHPDVPRTKWNTLD